MKIEVSGNGFLKTAETRRAENFRRVMEIMEEIQELKKEWAAVAIAYLSRKGKSVEGLKKDQVVLRYRKLNKTKPGESKYLEVPLSAEASERYRRETAADGDNIRRSFYIRFT
jgi:hypothetical protein